MKKFLLLTLLFVVCSCAHQSDEHLLLEARRASLPEFEQSVWIPLDTTTLTGDERACLEFVYSYLPLPDMAMYPFGYWLAQVRTALSVRENMGWKVPEREFRHFVLPVRVNNENLDDFRTLWADSLCRRVRGMSMYDAVLEINHWCHEQATYKPSDARTCGPLATIANGFGRCGEESVLGVAALRAVGIPARQVYTPRWAHTDDNHAWVEAWVDGKWYFMGACEPEPKLNIGWFNAPAGRAMLMHTRVFGDYNGDEGVINRDALHTEINVIANYVPTRTNTVTVVDQAGHPVEGATVEFKIYNYAEFYTVATYQSDKNGQASLETGLGDMLVWASKGGQFGFAKVSSAPLVLPTEGLSDEAQKALKPQLDKGEDPDEVRVQPSGQKTKVMKPGETYIVLDHEVGQRFSVDIDIVPPVENPIPAEVTKEERALNNARLAYEDSLRIAVHPVPAGQDVIQAFLARHSDLTEAYRACALVESLTEKDRRDVSPEVLEDAMSTTARTFRQDAHEDVWSEYIECPRVEKEALRPFRQLVDASFATIHSPMEVRDWVVDHIRLVESQNPQDLRMAPSAVWQYHVADKLSRDIFFVALCRALGFEARINEVTGQTQYKWKNLWRNADEETSASDSNENEEHKPCWLAARYTPQPFLPNPIYYTHFTLSSLNDGRAHLYNFEEGENTEVGTLASWESLLRHPYAVEKGYYLLTSGTRLASGTVLAHMEFASVGMGGHAMGSMLPDNMTVVPLVMRQADNNVPVIGHFDADPLLPYTGRGYYMIAIMGERDEPTIHAQGLLEGMKDELASWGRPVVELHSTSSMAKVTTGGTETEKTLTERVVPERLAEELCEACSVPFDRLPVVVIADSFGRIVYFSQGYNTSLAGDLRSTIKGL